MKNRVSLQDYFSFSRRERTGILFLTGLILVIFFLPSLYPAGKKERIDPKAVDWMAELKKLEGPERQEGKTFTRSRDYPGREPLDFPGKGAYTPAAIKPSLFYFDPNTLDSSGWRRLGLREKTIHTIIRYRSKGGQFREPGDLQRVYGLFPDEYERLAPYIRIDPGLFAKTRETGTPAPMIKKERVPVIVELNKADTGALIALPGIGSKLAARIIAFRDKLGGFYSADQVAETFGLPDSTYQKIRSRLEVNPGAIRKIGLNTVTFEELKIHPYIRFALAQTIIAYRNEHGPFSRIEDLKNIVVITDELFRKIAPYLELN